MKKLNNKGFAMSTVLYGIVIMVMLIVTLIITLMATNRSNSKWLVEETEEKLIENTYVTVEFPTSGYSIELRKNPGDVVIAPGADNKALIKKNTKVNCTKKMDGYYDGTMTDISIVNSNSLDGCKSQSLTIIPIPRAIIKITDTNYNYKVYLKNNDGSETQLTSTQLKNGYEVVKPATVKCVKSKPYYVTKTMDNLIINSDSSIDACVNQDMSLNQQKAEGTYSEHLGITESQTATVRIDKFRSTNATISADDIIVGVKLTGAVRMTLIKGSISVYITGSNSSDRLIDLYLKQTKATYKFSVDSEYKCSGYQTNLDSCKYKGPVTYTLYRSTGNEAWTTGDNANKIEVTYIKK